MTEPVISPSTAVGQYNATLPTVTDGQSGPLQADSRLRLITAPASSSSPDAVNLVQLNSATVSTTNAVPVNEKGVLGTFTTNTRPSNQTPYSIGDSISNNATAGSVTALTASLSDANDAPILLTDIVVTTSDTGIGASGVGLRAYIYNSDPTATRAWSAATMRPSPTSRRAASRPIPARSLSPLMVAWQRSPRKPALSRSSSRRAAARHSGFSIRS
jgi:hypothetical protein